MNKNADMRKYYNLIKYCCAYKNVFGYEEVGDRLDVLNDVLPKNCWIAARPDADKDYAEWYAFVDLFKKYRIWLFEKYVNSNFYFSMHYESPRRYRNHSGYKTFFAQTFMEFVREYIGENTYKLKNRYTGAWNLYGIVAHKALAGAVITCAKANIHGPYQTSLICETASNPNATIREFIFLLH